MAKLHDVAESLNIKLDVGSQQHTPYPEKASGKKRRAWLIDEKDEKSEEAYSSINQKGSINPINKPHLSTPNINPIYEPLYEKGSIRPVKKPLNLTLDKLRGNPLRIIQYLFGLLIMASAITTEKTTLLEIMKTLEISKDSARTGLRFLIKNNLVKRVDFHPGKHGWSKYELKKAIFTELEEAYQKGSINPINKKGSNSSSINNIKTTTKAGDEWNFDISSYARFGFTPSHIKQLASLSVISAVDVEQSLTEFNYDLDNNALPPIKTSKINFLMGLLRSGHLYVSEGFKNAQEEAIVEMARRHEGRRKNLLEAKFLAWEGALNEEARQQVLSKLPPSLMVLEKAHGIGHPDVKQWFFDYYLRQQQ